MKISFDGIGEKVATFINNGAEAGEPVKVSANGTVSPCSEGDVIDGICLTDEAYAPVVIGGFVTVAYSGTAPSAGHATLSADGDGGVAADEDGVDYLIVNVDSTNGTVTIKL